MVMLRQCFLINSLLLFALTLGCGSRMGTAGLQFEAARQRVHEGAYAAGADELKQFLSEYPGHDLSSRAYFLIAKAEMGRDDFAAAKDWFSKTRKMFPRSEEAHKAGFKIAMLAVMQGELDAALRQLRAMESSKGAYAPEVSAWIKHLQDELQQNVLLP